jgi:hypothetical protein
MKRSVVIFILAALVIILSLLWYTNTQKTISLTAAMQFIILLIVVGLALFIGVKRLTSYKRGEPAEDELSKKIQLKTASVSFYISIYLWLFIMFFSDRLTLENHTLIGIGIAGMALVYVLSWIIISLRGLKDE